MMTDLILTATSRSFRGKADIAVENGMITGGELEPNGHTRVLDVSGKQTSTRMSTRG